MPEAVVRYRRCACAVPSNCSFFVVTLHATYPHEADDAAHHIYYGHQMLDLPAGFGRTTDMTVTINALAKAGMPGAEVTSFNQLTLGDGRVALLTNCSPFWPVLAIDEIPPRHELILIADTVIPVPVVQLAKQVGKGILLVDLSRGLVWDEGRLVNGVEPRRGASRYRYAVFAAAKVLACHGGGFDRLMGMAGLTRPQVQDSLDVLEDFLRPFGSGWEARKSDELVAWILACYPGPGGVAVHWQMGAPLDVQAERLRAYADIRLSGSWAAHRQVPSIAPTFITAFSRTGVDLDPLGFKPSSWQDSTVQVIVPEDRHIVPLSRYQGPTGCADEFITAHILATHPRYSAEEQAEVMTQMRDQIMVSVEMEEDLRWGLPD